MPKQTERLLDYFETNPRVTPLMAWKELGISRLASVVFDLRRDGHLVISEFENVPNQFGDDCRIAVYSLAKSNPVPEGMLL